MVNYFDNPLIILSNRLEKLFDFSLLNVNISWFLNSFITVNLNVFEFWTKKNI